MVNPGTAGTAGNIKAEAQELGGAVITGAVGNTTKLFVSEQGGLPGTV